ncbi:hypothetical protein IU450_36150 [Nocardia abscessus]|uniref:hypothetical protein n=1 Tax=Nocardia abscessus TaxID=120957 RepID=UPI00189621A1|nr:hypothetical protein [Nocardia abscessus]MBF6341275.1 hypothetical protein [Nocardia abscessus]
MTTDGLTAAAARDARWVACRDLACPGCGHPPDLELASGDVTCRRPSCLATPEVPLGRWQRRCGIDRGPTGADRPHLGRPVPWLTPIYLDEQGHQRALWTAVDPDRMAKAQREMLCQFCGVAVPTDTPVTVIIDDTGWALTAAPLHADCAAVAMDHCPAVGRDGTALAVNASQIIRYGFIDPDNGAFEDWKLPRRCRASATAPRSRS